MVGIEAEDVSHLIDELRVNVKASGKRCIWLIVIAIANQQIRAAGGHNL